MKKTIKMNIIKNETGLFTVETLDTILGRQWDNNSTEIEIVKPVGFYETIRLTMDVYKYERAFHIHDTSVLGNGESYYYEGLQGIDSLEVRNSPIPLSNHISQYENIRIKFIFTDAVTGVIKNTETKDFKFLKSEKPVNFITYDVSPVTIKNGSVNLGNGVVHYTYSYLGTQDPDLVKITFGSKTNLSLPAALILMTASKECSGNIINSADYTKLANAKITNVVGCVPDVPVISISGITYIKTNNKSLIQAMVNDVSDEEKPCKLVQMCFDSENLYSVKNYNLIGSEENTDTPSGGGVHAVYGIPTVYAVPAGGQPTVAQSGDGSDENPYRLHFGVVEGKEGVRGLQGRNIRYCGNYVPGIRYHFTDENQDVINYNAEIIENGFKKVKSVLLYCITTNQKSDTILYDQNGIVDSVKDCWALGPITTSPAVQRYRGDWQPNVIYVNNFEYQDIVRIVQGTKEALVSCMRTNAAVTAPDLQNLSSDWNFFLKSSSIFDYAKTIGYSGTKMEFDEKLSKISDYAQRTGGNVLEGNQQITGNLSITGNIYHYGQNYQTQLEQLNIKNALITVREDAYSALPENQYAGIKAKHYNNRGDDGYLVFDNKGFAYVGDMGALQRLATIVPNNAENMLLYYNPNTLSIESTGISKQEFYDIKAKCDLLSIVKENNKQVLVLNGMLKVTDVINAEGLISSNVGFNKN